MKDDIRTGHLPPRIGPRFDGLFTPHMRAIFGKTTPWEAPAEETIVDCWAKVFPEEDPLDFSTPLGIIVQKLVGRLTQ